MREPQRSQMLVLLQRERSECGDIEDGGCSLDAVSIWGVTDPPGLLGLRADLGCIVVGPPPCDAPGKA